MNFRYICRNVFQFRMCLNTVSQTKLQLIINTFLHEETVREGREMHCFREGSPTYDSLPSSHYSLFDTASHNIVFRSFAFP
jgi:hypothetical protein